MRLVHVNTGESPKFAEIAHVRFAILKVRRNVILTVI